MSEDDAGLRELLDGVLPAGVYRWAAAPDPDGPRIAEQVRRTGWHYASVDGRVEPGRSGLLRGIGASLGFSSWYAANFDALADCLRDLPGPTVLLWSGWVSLALEDHQAFHTALDVLAERAADAVGPAFAVLLPGPGPDLSDAPAVARLD